MIDWLRTIACVALFCACSEPDVPGERAEVPPVIYTRACPDLPAERSTDLVVGFAVHDYERPEALARWAIVSEGASCPADELPAHLGYAPLQCVRLGAARFDALYAELRRAGLDRIRTRPLPEWPHRGGSEIGLSWYGAQCRIADVTHDTEPAPEDRSAYLAADDAIRRAITQR